MIGPQEHEAGTDLVSQVEAIFSPDGLLSRSKSFEYRPQQQAMAVAVMEALLGRSPLLVEAGTGVGKSLAYLIPAILYAVAHSRKAVVCTHTINLQEQLVEKDLPLLAQILPVEFKFTMLKGRHNYLCTKRLHKAMQQADGLFTTPEIQELHRIAEWARTTTDGSLTDFDHEPDPNVWAQVCSERGLCSPKICGSKSDFAKDNGLCFFQRARSLILGADLLVLNHTLFFTLLGGVEEVPDEGVLFKNDFVIFDEAHNVESVASRHIGLSVSSGQIRFALQRLWNQRTGKGLLSKATSPAPVPLVDELLTVSEEFFHAVEQECDALQRQRRADGATGWTELRIRRPHLVEDHVTLTIHRLREEVRKVIQGAADLDMGQELIECNRRLAELREAIRVFLSQETPESVYWVERSGRARKQLTLNAAPVDVADFLRRRLFGSRTSIIMTSATLATQGGPDGGPGTGGAEAGALSYFARRVGGESARALQVGSPFDYPNQMKLFVVGKMPDPREEGFRDALVHWIEHFLRLTHGKAFVLFTNARLMRELAETLQPVFHDMGVACFVQGTGMPRSVMLEEFKQNRDSVLFGTDSFWQGVDVPGESLSNVIITRLPFAVPDHPLIEARVETIEARGGNSFAEFSLPEAILKFRQGVGRLIRSKRDRGIVVILDNRVLNKRYGRSFLEALPKCPMEVV